MRREVYGRGLSVAEREPTDERGTPQGWSASQGVPELVWRYAILSRGETPEYQADLQTAQPHFGALR